MQGKRISDPMDPAKYLEPPAHYRPPTVVNQRCKLGRRLSVGLHARHCKRDRVALCNVVGRHLSGGFKHRIGDRTDVGMNALEVAQDVEVERGRFDRFRPTCAQALEVVLGGLDFGETHPGLFGNQLTRIVGITFAAISAIVLPSSSGRIRASMNSRANVLEPPPNAALVKQSARAFTWEGLRA